SCAKAALTVATERKIPITIERRAYCAIGAGIGRGEVLSLGIGGVRQVLVGITNAVRHRHQAGVCSATSGASWRAACDPCWLAASWIAHVQGPPYCRCASSTPTKRAPSGRESTQFAVKTPAWTRPTSDLVLAPSPSVNLNAPSFETGPSTDIPVVPPASFVRFNTT